MIYRALLPVLVVAGCDINPHDATQVPTRITISDYAPTPEISWTPGDAQKIQVYKGDKEHGPELL